MAFNVSSLTTGAKRQRKIMIITADESIIDEIEKTNNASLFKQIVLEADVDNNESSNQQTQVRPSHQKNKTNGGSLICVVCGSSAFGYNFGAIVCESCKAFFRRNALKNPITFQCRNRRNCEITFETRRICSPCRLAKCFNSGMEPDRILTTEQKAAKRRKIEENRSLALDSNSKTNERQSHLSPSVFADELLTPIDTNILLLTDFTEILSPQTQRVVLSSEDLQRVETISLLYQNRIELASRDGLPWDPSMHTATFLQTLNSQSVSVMRLLSFFKQIPEFNELNVDDKVTLIKYNLMTVLGINCTLSYNTETDQIIETDSDIPWNTQFFQILHGYNICMQSKKIFGSLLQIAKYDQKIIQLILITLILTKGFSSTNDHEPLLNDKMAVFRAQSYHLELLWKYMEIVHGSEKAVRLFSELIAHVISWQTIQEEMRNNVLRILSPTDLNELLPIMKSVLRIS